MKKLIFILSLFILLAVTAKPTHAADCVVVYGGGQTECVKAQTITPVQKKGETPTATPTHSAGSGQATPPPATQSKGGLPIQPAPEVKITPATGPEALSILALVPLAGAGWYLRRKKI